MAHTISVKTYNGQTGFFTIPEDVVDSLYLVLHYYVSGDEIYNFITEDGKMYIIDAADIPGASTRELSCGPEDLSVIFPEEMEWKRVHEA